MKAFCILLIFCLSGLEARQEGAEILDAIANLDESEDGGQELPNDLDNFLVGALTPGAISTGLLGDPGSALASRLHKAMAREEASVQQGRDSSDSADKDEGGDSSKQTEDSSESEAPMSATPEPNSTHSNSTILTPIICDAEHNKYTWPAVLLNVVLLCVGGIPLCFAGYRLFKPALFLFGFGTCYMLVYQLIMFHNFHGETHWVAPLCASIGGLIGGILAVLVVQAGLFLVGFALGGFSVVAVLMVVAQVSTSATEYLHQHAWLALIIVIVAGCVFGAATIKFEKPLIIGATALEGSWIIFQAVDYFVENTGSDVGQALRLVVQFIPRNAQFVSPWHPGITSCWIVNTCFAIWPTMLVLGLLVQVGVTGRNCDHRQAGGKASSDLKPRSFHPEQGYGV